MGHFPSDPGTARATARSSPFDVLCIGESIWDARLATDAEHGSRLALVPGGGAWNAARALTARGLAVSLCGAIGDDVLGRMFREAAARAEVDLTGAATRGARNVGHTGLVQIAPAGACPTMNRRGQATDGRDGGPAFTSDRDVVWEARTLVRALASAPDARVVLLSGLLPHVPLLDRARRFLARARARGAFVMVDLNARSRLWASASSAARIAALDALAHAHFVKSSLADERSLGLASGDAQREFAGVWLRTDGPAPVIVHAFGACTSHAVGSIATSDATGAGDALTAGVIGAMLATREEDRASEEAWTRAISKGISRASEMLSARAGDGRV